MLDWGFDMKKDNKDILAILGVAILFVALVVVGPLFTLLALNTLFPTLAIPYTFGTWFAALWVMFLLNGSVKKQ